MAEITLAAEAGRTTGTRPSGRLRASGRIPAVVYGHGRPPLAVSVDARELRQALTTSAGLNQLLDLTIGDQRFLTLAREVQRHPVRNTVTHVDFLVVRRDEVISAEVPVLLTGEAKAVETERGVIAQPLTSLTVRAVPGSIPGSIELDVSDLAVGDTIRVGDLHLPAGVVTEVDPEDAVVVASPSEVVAEVALEAGEAAEAAGAVGAGAAPEGAEGGKEAGGESATESSQG